MAKSAGEPPGSQHAPSVATAAGADATAEFVPPGATEADATWDAATTDAPAPSFAPTENAPLLVPRRARSGGAGPADRPAAIVASTAPDLTRETSLLRQDRLRAAAAFLIAGLAVGMVWPFFLGSYDGWELQSAELLLLAAVVVALSRWRPVPPRGLRALEILTFGSVAALMSWGQYETVLYEGRAHDPAGLTAGVENAIANTALLILTYAMLIPNRWPVAAGVVSGIALVPLLTQAVLFGRHPEVLRFAHEVATPERIVGNMMTLVIASALAIYGTAVLNRLRREAFEARRLNQYRLGRPLGVGGMGEVYLAEHHLLKRPCAIKLIRADRAGDPTALLRFEREVQATARLSHPNTVEIYDYGRTNDGTFYYVMEYLRGLTLEDLVARHGPLPAGRVVYLLRQACGALAEAHGAGLIHRDLKPGNLFAARRGGLFDVAKLLDFGLVKPQDEDDRDAGMSREGFVRGTPQYMAPEQVTGGRQVDGRCDLYALGGVAYFLLTGRPPFDGPSAVAVMIAQARDPVEPPSRCRAEVPADLEAVVLRCLAKDPAGRYADAEALERALAGCAAAADWDAARAASWWAGQGDG
jgi:serine/threonine-protein kinase